MISLQVNGTDHQIEVDPDTPLLWVLRDQLGLTGTKYGCGEGQCRACTVLLDGRAVVSCVTPVRSADGREIVTIEGVSAGNELHPVQQAFIEEGAMQCGYCTPGMVLRTIDLLRTHPHPSDAQIIETMNGSLCRCCGYPRIVAAVKRAAASVPDLDTKGGSHAR